MPDAASVDAQIAQGVQVKTPDMIGPISSLAQLGYMQANANRANAEAANLSQQMQFGRLRMGTLQDYTARIQRGEPPESAAVSSGMTGIDPTGGEAALKNVQLGREIGAVRGYDPNNPASLAAGGPELVGKGATALKTQAETAETQQKIQTQQTVLLGHVGNMMDDPSPLGRQRAAQLAHNILGPQYAQVIDKALKLPDDKWMALGKELQAVGQTAKEFMETSGQEELNKEAGKVAGGVTKFAPGERGIMGPGAAAAVAGQPIPRLGQSGVVNMPSVPPATPTAASAKPLPSVPYMPAFAQTVANNPGGWSQPRAAAAVGKIESSFDPTAHNGSHGGIIQAGDDWASQYGLRNKFDPLESISALGRAGVDYANRMRPMLGRQPTDAELYLAHQQGVEGALKLLANPNARAGSIVGDAAIRGNGGDPNAPASQFTNMWTGRFNMVMNGDMRGSAGFGANTPFGGRTLMMPAGVTGNVPGTPQATPPESRTAGWLLAAQAARDQGSQGQGGGAAPTPATALATKAQATPQAPPPAPETDVPTIANPTGSKTKTGTAADNTRPLLQPLQGGGALITGTTLQEKEEQEETGKALGELPGQFASAANAARGQNAIIDEMNQSMNGWEPGRFSDWKQDGREILQSFAKTFGLKADNLDEATGNFQDFEKLGGGLVREAVHQTTSRSGVQEMQMITKQMPGPGMTRYGIQMIFSQMKGMNDFSIAKQQAAAAWKQQYKTLGSADGTGGMDFQTYWNKNASPGAFIMDRMSRDNPTAYNNMVHNMAQTDEGKTALQNIRKELVWAKQNELVN